MKVSSKTLIYKKAPIVSLQGQPVLLFNEQTTLLNALESKAVDVFSECRSGFCGACKTKVNSGEVSYIHEPLASLEEGECLPCCCKPESDLDLDIPHGRFEESSKKPD
ncbi:ferredoxin [Shewanella sp. OPT22]|nr:ferredoxin [Shewanella sp. OPT22]